jgi:hypothetical protein
VSNEEFFPEIEADEASEASKGSKRKRHSNKGMASIPAGPADILRKNFRAQVPGAAFEAALA